MKVAVTYEKETGNIFQHFGKTQYFKIYEIEDGKILSSEVIDNSGNGHHAIPPYLKSLGVEALILGNRGQGAIEAIAASGLKEMPGITGSADSFQRGTGSHFDFCRPYRLSRTNELEQDSWSFILSYWLVFYK